MLVTGCALGVVAISFSLVYATTKIFHVAHAGIYTLGGYLAWSLLCTARRLLVALLVADRGVRRAWRADPEPALRPAGTAPRDASGDPDRLARRVGGDAEHHRRSLYAEHPAIPAAMEQPTWCRSGAVRLTYTQMLTIVVSLAAYAGAMLFAHRTILGKRIRAVASNPMLADITRLQPQTVYIYVIAIASALVCLPGMLVPLDLGLQPYNGVTPLLTATIAMIAGGVGSITGAFVLSVAIAVLQNLSLLVMPGEWSIGVTFFIFVIFMLFRPTGLFTAPLSMDFLLQLHRARRDLRAARPVHQSAGGHRRHLLGVAGRGVRRRRLYGRAFPDGDRSAVVHPGAGDRRSRAASRSTSWSRCRRCACPAITSW